MPQTSAAPEDSGSTRAQPGFVVAVDGPSGAGKSTVCRALARRLGARYLDTGSMYRAVTRQLLDAGVDPDDPEAVAAGVAHMRLEVGTDPVRPTVRVDGVDLSGLIRGPEVTAAVSAVSAVPAVRAQMVELQQQVIAAGGPVVVEGRDIGTTVAPSAPVKVFLTADTAARAERRTLELRSSSDEGVSAVTRTRADLLRRDALDSSRAVSPFTQAPDAVEIDTTAMTVDEVVAAILRLVESAGQVGRIEAAGR